MDNYDEKVNFQMPLYNSMNAENEMSNSRFEMLGVTLEY